MRARPNDIIDITDEYLNNSGGHESSGAQQAIRKKIVTADTCTRSTNLKSLTLLLCACDGFLCADNLSSPDFLQTTCPVRRHRAPQGSGCTNERMYTGPRD